MQVVPDEQMRDAGSIQGLGDEEEVCGVRLRGRRVAVDEVQEAAVQGDVVAVEQRPAQCLRLRLGGVR